MIQTSFKTVSDKYDAYADQSPENELRAMNGDIINVIGTTTLSGMIAWGDAKSGDVGPINTHSLLCMIMFDKTTGQIRRFALQAEANGVIPDYLSDAIKSNVRNFEVLRPKAPRAIIDAAVSNSWTDAEAKIPYDFYELPKVLIHNKFPWLYTKVYGNPHDAICSVYTGKRYAGQFARCYDAIYAKQGYLSPADLTRYLNPADFDVIWKQGITG